MAAARLRTLNMRFHRDERRTFYGDIYSNPDGDTNVVYLEPHVPIAWHRHQRQADRLFLIRGILQVRCFTDSWATDGVVHILIHTGQPRDVLHIPPNTWHGYEALVEGTIVLQFNGPGKWTGDDEERHPIDDEMPWTPT
jgi:dTDP-4-dehydrorhamnose 3,5-epimerase-like enzyme